MYLNFLFEHKYNNMDQRVILDTIASVKYYLIANNNEKFLPYNYNRIIEASAKIDAKTYNAYKGNNTLPLGYTYNAYISRVQYDQMTVTEKQQALLQGCVLDESSHLEITATEWNNLSAYSRRNEQERYKYFREPVTYTISIKSGLLISFISLMALIGIGVYFKINMWLYRRKCTCSLKQAKYSR